jgi:hypothetical protein
MKRTPTEATSLFIKVTDSHNQPIRGLWKRGSRYYAQLAMPVAGGGMKMKRVPLEASTDAEARHIRRGCRDVPGGRHRECEAAQDGGRVP